jgi:hypothetical protein
VSSPSLSVACKTSLKNELVASQKFFGNLAESNLNVIAISPAHERMENDTLVCKFWE